jgi:hypothetical protein
MKIAIAFLALFLVFIAQATSLTWDPPSSGGAPTSYNIYKLRGNSSNSDFIGATTSTTFKVDFALTGNRTVFYVVAVNASGEGAPSPNITIQKH